MARVRIQLRRKRYADRLRDIMQESLQLAVIDPLTGLHNRRYLESNLGQMIESAVDGEKPLSLMILDIDHFKAVNDTHGHDAGDEIVRAFAERIKTVIRGVDLLCRLGGEEFIIVMPDTTLEVAAKVAERVRHCIGAALFAIDNGMQQIPVTVSIGLADHRRGREPDQLMKRADRALYRSKTMAVTVFPQTRPDPTRKSCFDSLFRSKDRKNELVGSRCGDRMVIFGG